MSEKLMKTERVPIMFDRVLLQKLDEYSFKHQIRGRAETVRRLVLRGMENEQTKKADATA